MEEARGPEIAHSIYTEISSGFFLYFITSGENHTPKYRMFPHGSKIMQIYIFFSNVQAVKDRYIYSPIAGVIVLVVQLM